MRTVGIALAILAMALTSGGVAQTSAEPERAAAPAEASAQCRISDHGAWSALSVLATPPVDPERAKRVRPLSTRGYNLQSDPGNYPAPVVSPPASPRR